MNQDTRTEWRAAFEKWTSTELEAFLIVADEHRSERRAVQCEIVRNILGKRRNKQQAEVLLASLDSPVSLERSS